MAKKLLIIALLLLIVFITRAQVPAFKSNASEGERQQSDIYKNFGNKYDFMIAYTRQSWWWGGLESYEILAVNNGSWVKGGFSTKKKKTVRGQNPRLSLQLLMPIRQSTLLVI